MITRRKFIAKLGLAAGVLTPVTLLGKPSVDRDWLANEYKAIRIKGRITSRGKGIGKVVVTDGLSVVSTDGQGYYELLSNNHRDYVYLSMPAGYAFQKQSNGSVTQFKAIDKKRNDQSIVFDLEPLTVSDQKHYFFLLADPQIESEFEAEQLLTITAPDVKRAVDSINDPNTFGIGCGDLVFDKLSLYKEYNQAITKMGIPFFQVVGNHDMDLTARSDEPSTATFKTHFGPTYYSFNRGEVHYVVLDDVFFLGGHKYVGYVSEEQLAWLEQDLLYVEPGRTVVVSLHIPLTTGEVQRYPSWDHGANTVSNKETVYELLKPFNVHVMSGHTHFNDNLVHGNIYEHCHGTVCGAWWSGPICYDGTPNGYGVYEVSGSTLKWKYKGTGEDINNQFRIYDKGYHPDYKEFCSVNVWNWDPQWKVFWYEDGIRKGEMLRIVSHDPLSIELHSGEELPKRREWVEPRLTDHMFYFNPDKLAKKVTVEVVDRFGNKYTKQLFNK